MLTTNDEYRTMLLAEAAAIQAKQQALRAYLCAHLGEAAGLYQFELISMAESVKDLSDDQLALVIQHKIGLPAGYCLSKEQLDKVCRAYVPTGPGGGPVQLQAMRDVKDMSDEELEERIRALSALGTPARHQAPYSAPLPLSD